MEDLIPEIVEELYQTYGAEEVQRGYPPQASNVPHALWAFYQGLLIGVKLRAAVNACPSSPAAPRRPRTP